jgi:release factor glutamine methyltransferase
MSISDSGSAQPVTVSDWIGWGRRSLESHLDRPEEESRYLMEAVLGSRTSVWTQAFSPLEQDKVHLFQNWIARRIRREPFHLIVGEVDFCGRFLTIRSGVLVPRPETELVVQCCVQDLKRSDRKKNSPLRILDLGAGSGAIAISILMEIPDSRGVAVELEPKALSVLQDNRIRYNLENRLAVVRGDWGEMLSSGPLFDCIVSNPPYIPTAVIESLEPEIRCYEPISALDGGVDGLRAYRNILSFAPGLLREGGILVFEIGSDQANAEPFRTTTGGCDDALLIPPKILKDVSGHDRVIFWKKKV